MWLKNFKFYNENSEKIGEIELEDFYADAWDAVYKLTRNEFEKVKAAFLAFCKGKVDEEGNPRVTAEFIQDDGLFGELLNEFQDELEGKLYEQKTYTEFDKRIETEKQITPRELFKIAEENGLLDYPIRWSLYSNPEEDETDEVPLLDGRVSVEDDFIELCL